MIINLTSKQRRIAAFVAGVCTSFVFAVVFAHVAQAQVAEPVYPVSLEKNISDNRVPDPYTADQFTFTIVGTSASGTPVNRTVSLDHFTNDTANKIINLPMGDYTISEDGPNDFVAGEWTVQWSGFGCDNYNGPIAASTLTVTDDQTANVCRADNQWRPGNLTVIKEVVGTTTPPEDFEFMVTQGNLLQFDGPFDADGVNDDITLASGDYKVEEDTYAAYTTTYSSGCEGTINQGGSETCTITNTWITQPVYSQSSYYTQGSYNPGYSQSGYYTQGSYGGNYAQGSYGGNYAQGSYGAGGYSQGSYSDGNGRRIELRDGGGDGDDDDDQTGAPAPQVLGESTDIPQGAPGTGKGGASRSMFDLQAGALFSGRKNTRNQGS